MSPLTIDGKFIGRWEPATTCKCFCGRRLSVDDGLRWLGGIQICLSLFQMTWKLMHSIVTEEMPEELSEPAIDFALACWMLRGIDKGAADPINHFSFAQFLLAVKLSVDLLVATVFTISTLKDSSGVVVTIIFSLVYGYFTIPCKIYYSFMAWSKAQHLCRHPASTGGIGLVEGNTSASLTYHAKPGGSARRIKFYPALEAAENALFGAPEIAGGASEEDGHDAKTISMTEPLNSGHATSQL